ncbi:Hint domain-containing protein [Psychromarinibacter halotolerans]|uniref:Hint domain-containing protein n=1 Tax=Psychromarinibacter halotolerans TaxID=1775175 RepID=A0ABV7GRV7_9RHOB|nr:Hint domain-containing protein [Psychromarinibacter halotolerans]MDF0596647.1 Hint domain-containing protein [Psychromarinibacter halotolerans]
MPLYDFQTTALPTTTVTLISGVGFTYVADGVKFTVSFTNASNQGDVVVTFGAPGGGIPGPFYIADSLTFDTAPSTVPDVIRLTLESTADTDNTVFTGTALNPVALQMDGSFNSGSFDIAFTDSINGTGTVSYTTYTSNQLLTAVGSFTGITFTSSLTSGTDNAQMMNSLFVNSLECFCEDTLITTPSGQRAVQDLAEGDEVLTADGRTVAIRWLGRTMVDPAVSDAARVSPVRISKGALGNGLPERDLLVSAEHAVALDGKLVNAGALLNGTTIRRDKRTEPFAYYHVETDAHELILAEGVAAETYLEQRSDVAFDNADTRMSRVVPEMDLPRVASSRLLQATAA